MKNIANNPSQHDRRARERTSVRLSGRLFVVEEKLELTCIVTDLSVDGAGVYCPEPPPLDAFVLLYIDGFGRFEAVATRYGKGELGLKFNCNDTKRTRIAEDLARFVNEGIMNVTRLRRYKRSDPDNQISHFICADGSSVACEVLDISFQGARLKTAARPPIGEVIHLGKTPCWIIRHHDQGIGVQFQQRPQRGQPDGH